MSNRILLRTDVEPTWVRKLREQSASPAAPKPSAAPAPTNVLIRAMQTLLARKYPTL